MPHEKTEKSFTTSYPIWSLYRQRQRFLLCQLLLLSIITRCAIAGPVSSPEIASKSNQQINSVNGGANQQQQQQTSFKANSQEPQLNTLNAYAAANYDVFTEADFKPSYKLPDMETNFTPIQSGINIGTSNALTGPLPSPTPVIMQYLRSQPVHENGVQYLQLIPTRPLIVPISPFISSQSSASYHQPLTVENSITDYANRSPAVITPIYANNNAAQTPPTSPTLLNLQSPHLHYGLHTYANAIQPYRTNFRINREIKDKNIPVGLTLNLNEYFPGPQVQQAQHHLYIRGRP